MGVPNKGRETFAARAFKIWRGGRVSRQPCPGHLLFRPPSGAAYSVYALLPLAQPWPCSPRLSCPVAAAPSVNSVGEKVRTPGCRRRRSQDSRLWTSCRGPSLARRQATGSWAGRQEVPEVGTVQDAATPQSRPRRAPPPLFAAWPLSLPDLLELGARGRRSARGRSHRCSGVGGPASAETMPSALHSAFSLCVTLTSLVPLSYIRQG